MSNRLQKEDSPYLQQHKDNPVHWFAWSDEAFSKAKLQNKAIFISIGYSSCHWCHVMEKNVFENQECADTLNRHFICIKVDREERPDIDKHYQEVYRLLNNRAGGWPTSIFCTPENKAFFAATYIPAESNQVYQGSLGFKDLTKTIAQKIDEKDSQIFDNAKELQKYLKYEDKPKEATNLKDEFYKIFLKQVEHNFDEINGGFSTSPKFPNTSILHSLISIARLKKDTNSNKMFKHTLNSMIQGGMYDLVDGGFCRYSVDEKWLIPHFEKMLYDNALLCELYTMGYQIYGDEIYLQTAKDTADFWIDYMSEDNLFYSASDADSDGVEGKYFIYTYKEVYNLLKENGYSDIKNMLNLMQISETGNFEDKNIIRFEKNNHPEWFKDVKKLLRKLRKKRAYPFIDKKIQTSWSSMMINSLFSLGKIENSYTKRAIKSLDALLKTIYLDDVLYHVTLIHKKPKIKAFLEDYAFLSKALINAYSTTFNEIYLINAQKFTNNALKEFYKNGSWYFSNNEFKTMAEVADSTYTSSVSIMVDVLLSLSSLLEDEKYKHFAFKTLEFNSYNLARKPIYTPYLLEQTLRYTNKDILIKSDKNNLKSDEIFKLEYPFINLKNDKNDSFTICTQNKCFANTSDIKEVNKLINNSFSL